MVWLFTAAIFLAAWLVRWWMMRTYTKWHAVPNAVGANGAQIARHILDSNRLQHVQLEVSEGQLTDHYIPARDLMRLSQAITHQSSVASLAVAAHECGHAIQDATNYPLLKWKAALMPLALVGNNMGMLLAIGGGLLGMPMLVDVGMLLFGTAIIMPLLTLPIEFDASKRALEELTRLDLVSANDYEGARSMLTAAALTYVSGAATSMLFVVLIAVRFLRR